MRELFHAFWPCDMYFMLWTSEEPSQAGKKGGATAAT